jgi:hypothetical protein
MGESLVELRRRVYRRSIRRVIGVVEAIDELLAEATDEEERQRLEWLRAVIEAYHEPRQDTARRQACL